VGRTQHIARAALVLSPCLAWSCASRPARTQTADAAPLVEALRDAPEAPAPGALVVRLAFGAAADLDLYVTDPLRETVYFANTPSRSGGRLDRDRTCSDAAPRIESVVFERPPPGRYRVGIDYPKSCDGSDSTAPYVLTVQHREDSAQRIEGSAAPRRFEPVVLEVDVE
jgi:hypothetical protein